MSRAQQTSKVIARTLCAALFCLALALPHAVFAQGADDLETKEAKVKSAFLLNFARYVEWPENAFAATNSPIVIGVLGQDPLGRHLEETVEGKTVEKHPVHVKRGRRISELNDCHVLFVCVSERDRLRATLAQLQGKPILTVSDMDGFATDGGMILLKKKQGLMRFEINREAAERGGLKISSKLLKLADNYR
jgi:hypothetical protein